MLLSDTCLSSEKKTKQAEVLAFVSPETRLA
jgi:hypothetical protein